MEKVNLIYFKDKSINGNFGDELSKVITYCLINRDKYILVANQNNIEKNILCIGSYIHCAKDMSYIYGSGVRTPNNIERGHHYNNLNVTAVRGPLTRNFLIHKGIEVPEIYGDPALLLPYFYSPKKHEILKHKIGIIPHKSNFDKYISLGIDNEKFVLINPTDKWQNVIDQLCSCSAIMSSSLHGLICADAYQIPNIWLDEHPLAEGDFKFKDYFASQGREYIKINSISSYDSCKLYTDGNRVNLKALYDAFPFK